MNNKRDKGPDNPWVRKVDPEEDEKAAPEPELPPSPWSLEVPPRPSPWTTQPVLRAPGRQVRRARRAGTAEPVRWARIGGAVRLGAEA